MLVGFSKNPGRLEQIAVKTQRGDHIPRFMRHLRQARTGDSLWKLNAHRHHIAPATGEPSRCDTAMNDLIWLGAVAGLFLLTLAYTRLCDGA